MYVKYIKWLGLPKAEQKRQGSGKRESTWQIMDEGYQTLARNVAGAWLFFNIGKRWWA